MPNYFYNDFDCAYLDGTGPPVTPDHRSPFAVDRDRLVFSFAFRRLQSKTQVFQSGVYDYYRTRLTHSIEVARIGCSIAEWLLHQKDTPLTGDFFIDKDLLEAVCLAHDLGHPSYGHIGERKLNELMAQAGGFEGNAQTLRMLTDLIYKNGQQGLRPTRAFMDGVMKYKALRGEWITADCAGALPKNHFIYDDQQAVRDFVCAGVDAAGLPQSPEAWNASKSIECQIMDWADDSAYCVHDILDGIQTGFITHQKLVQWKDEHCKDDADLAKGVDELLDVMAKGNFEAALGKKIGIFINACSLREREHALAGHSNRYAWELVVEDAARAQTKLFKRLAVDLIFKSTQIQQLEYKGGLFLGKMYEALMEHYAGGGALKLLPEDAHVLVLEAPTRAQKARRVCDFLSSLTDLAAPRLYKRLFDPDTGFADGSW